MNYYGYPPGYDPAPAKSDTPAPVPANVKARAAADGATHLSADGKAAYVERCGRWYEMRWDGTAFGSWWSCGDGLPDGAVRL